MLEPQIFAQLWGTFGLLRWFFDVLCLRLVIFCMSLLVEEISFLLWFLTSIIRLI